MSCENCANAYDEGYTAGHNAENARLRAQAEALAEAASIAYEYLGSITVTPNDWRFGLWEELGAALRAYREPWATVHTKYLDDQLVERCITCLERWPCKEDNHDDRH